MFTHFKRTMEALQNTMSEIDAEMDSALRYVEEQSGAGVSITNNSGHIVIVGPIKSLRVGDQVIDLKGTP